nr:hypothetical protein [Streptomyces sioyaensis]
MPENACCTVATPPTTGIATGGVPSPKPNVTVPVGEPPPATGFTAAVKVTGWLATDGSGAAVTVVVVASCRTAWVAVATAEEKSPLPL